LRIESSHSSASQARKGIAANSGPLCADAGLNAPVTSPFRAMLIQIAFSHGLGRELPLGLKPDS
jgi:hypothetical protein